MSLSLPVAQFTPDRFDAIAIGSSTGGPATVESIVAGLPADLPVPIFVAQHLPPTFTPSFATHLDRQSPLTAVHCENGMPVLPGTIYVGVGHQHMRVRRGAAGRRQIEISPEPTHLLYRPSVDELLSSCAACYGSRVLGVVLSGIGRDGAAGAEAVVKAGGVILTQRKDTCSVYGMPRACDEAGLSSGQLTPGEIRSVLLRLSPGHGKDAPALPAAAARR